MSARGRLRLASLRATVVTLLRRLFRGPRRPSWSLRYEILVQTLRRFLGEMAGHGAPALRAAWQELARPALRGVARDEVQIGALSAEWFTPPGVGEDARVLLYFHGGSYVWGSADTHAEVISRIAIAARARVLAPNYRLAPEHPWPAAHEDALAAYRWLLARGQRPVVGGDSAGGNLSLCLALRARSEGLPQPLGLALLCPWVDLSGEGGSIAAHAGLDWIVREAVEPWVRGYFPEGELRDPRASPLYAELTGLPPTLVQGGGAEVLLDQIVELGQALTRARVPHALHVYPDMVHVWQLYEGMFPEHAGAIREVGRFVRDPEGFVANHQAASGGGHAGLANK